MVIKSKQVILTEQVKCVCDCGENISEGEVVEVGNGMYVKNEHLDKYRLNRPVQLKDTEFKTVNITYQAFPGL